MLCGMDYLSLEKCDLLVTTGGVSMGDRDLLRYCTDQPLCRYCGDRNIHLSYKMLNIELKYSTWGFALVYATYSTYSIRVLVAI
jgi:hypothetical protein